MPHNNTHGYPVGLLEWGDMQLDILLANSTVSTTGAQAIQLALTPVFLLTGIAGLLNVMTGRLSRIVDRGRRLTETTYDTIALPPEDRMHELRYLEKRRHLTNNAITASTLSALLTCVVIVLLFAEVLFGLPVRWLEGIIFTSATLSLIVGLSFFLREVHLATKTIRIGWDKIAPTPIPQTETPEKATETDRTQ